MRVAGARRERRDGAVVVGARFEWEDAGIAPVELEFAGEGAAAEHLLPDANAFLLAAAFPAARRGERRIALEGAVCPVLRDGLATAARILDGWYGGARRIPTIEPSGGFRAPFPPPRRSASFLSGGVDSVELLLTNRAQFGSDHPASIRDVLLLDGFPLACPGGSDARRNHSERALRSAGAVAAAAGAPLTRVSTNLAALESDFGFSEREWYGAAFAAVAHLFSSRFSSVALASDYALSGAMPPNGSHPLLDP
ncbi:MAG TPA: hypothetical protein VG777_07530, partial [Thermoanaerobaculia bacterium]|nr:hypothetical protein [Thermoanaerobaculia bacterium]